MRKEKKKAYTKAQYVRMHRLCPKTGKCCLYGGCIPSSNVTEWNAQDCGISKAAKDTFKPRFTTGTFSRNYRDFGVVLCVFRPWEQRAMYFYYFESICSHKIYMTMKTKGRCLERLYKKTGLIVHSLAYTEHIQQ